MLTGSLPVQVVAMEPSEELILRVHFTQTALVLGGSVSSPVPPDLLIASPQEIGHPPLQEDTVKSIASVLSPLLCPSTLSSRFRVAVLLCGLSGLIKESPPSFLSLPSVAILLCLEFFTDVVCTISMWCQL